jgi:hypothetical protein
VPARIEPAIGVVDGLNRDFRAPLPFQAESLVVFLNGQQLKRQLENGWEEIDPSLGTFRMKVAPRSARPGAPDDPGDILFVYFDTGASTGGADGGIPEILGLDVLSPRLLGAADLRPRPAAGEDLDEGVGPPLLGETDAVVPEAKTATVLSPKIAGAEEV